MIAKTSPLKLKQFILFGLDYAFSVPDTSKKEVKWPQIFEDYPINITFDHYGNDEGLIEVHIKIGVNENKQLPGFTLSGEGVGIFTMEEEQEQDAGLISNLRIFSSLNICINALRNEFVICTSQSPVGRYYLPAIDIAYLIDQKQKGGSKK